MANTTFLSTSELDFNALRDNLKNFLKGQDQFSDYDFDGSNISVLLDILAYNTYLNSYYLNMVGSEMFLDTSQLKESAVSHAKELNYIPRSRASAEALVDITIVPGDSPDSIVIPENYRFTTMMDGLTYNFYVDEDHIVVANNGTYLASNVSIYEGRLVTEFFDVSANALSNGSIFTLESETLDTRSIKVYVYESNTSTVSYSYTQTPSLFGLTGTSNNFFIQGYKSNQYQIQFGNGVTGRKLSPGNRVKVVYRSTTGVLGNGAGTFNKTSLIQGYSSITATTVLSARNGTEREDINAIKFNAPRFFNTQERAVTAQDYISLTLAKFPQFQAVTAYGGETLTPPQYGKVAISIKPSGSTGILSDAIKAQVVEYLSLKNLTTEPIIIDPDMFYLKITSNVKYDPRLTTLGQNALRNRIANNIINFGQTYLNNFGTDFSYSKLLNAIDNTDNSIIGNDTDTKVTKRWSPIPQVSNTITFSFHNELYNERILYELPQGHELIISSSPFNYVYEGVTYSSYIGDNGLGELKIYTDQYSGNVLTRIVLNDNAGKVNYYTGRVSLTANVDSYAGSHINIIAKLKDKDVSIRRNSFLLINNRDVIINLIPVIE